MNTKKMLNNAINSMVEINSEDLKRCAAWASSISISELEDNICSGLQFQKTIGKSEEECAKYIFRNFKKELSGIINFNKEMGINFQ